VVLVVGMLVVGVVIGIAAFFVAREATRLAQEPPPPLFSMDDAYDWVVERLPDDVAATLTPADLRRILAFQMEFFRRKGASRNGSSTRSTVPAIIGGAETVDYIIERSTATGEPYIPEQIHPVVELQLEYLREIGAIGPRVERDDRSDP
jgi:hypothetical protein